jgi:xanthine/CO dehydrogenase XdhC/CoxF family maturation factor
MDTGHIMVGALTAAALALAVWAEIHSRRNTRTVRESLEGPDSETQCAEHLESKRARS